MIKCNLIIDGNYILYRNTFALQKNNLLFGSLLNSLEISISNYRKWFPFKKVLLVSDSKEKSWRKKIYPEYKENRKKDSDIDWEFVYRTYDDFKNNIENNKNSSNITILESPHIEGDDWISYLINEFNLKGESTMIVSNDYDIKQLISYNLNPLYINIMFNEIFNKQKVFLPKNYNIFLNTLNTMDNDDIFNLNDNQEFTQLINNFAEKYEILEINSLESLLIKVISGDKSDNIESVWVVEKNGKKRGIGETGSKKIYEELISEYSDTSLDDSKFIDNLSEVILANKKLPISDLNKLKQNITHNMSLVNLKISELPNSVFNRMDNQYKNKNEK